MTFFKDFFQYLVRNTLQKNRAGIQVYHETPPEDESLFSPTERGLTPVRQGTALSTDSVLCILRE